MARINKRLLKIKIAATDYTAEVSKAVVTSAESDQDFVTFYDAAQGGARTYKLAFTAVQDPTTGTVWDKVFSAPGTTVACILMPFGNVTATVAQPHFTFNAVVTEPDGDFIGGEADKSPTAYQVIECEWTLEAKPVKVTA